MRKLLCFVLAILVVGLVAGCAQMDAKEIAKKAEEKYKLVKDMKGTLVITDEVHGKKFVEKTEFAIKKPDKYWSTDGNVTIVRNGSTMWIYDKKANEVIVTRAMKMPKFDYGKFIQEILKNNDVKLTGIEKVSGRNCYIIEVIPKNKTYYTQEKIWIDTEYWYPLKVEIHGKFNMTIEYKDVKFNTGIPDSLFNFKPPKGAKVMRLNNSFGS